MGKHFINPDLAAVNVLEVPLDTAVLGQACTVARQLQHVAAGTPAVRLDHASGTLALNAARPHEWGSDVVWWSADDVGGFAWFEQLFLALDLARHVAAHVDHMDRIRLYAGFFVVRRECQTEYFHADWLDGQNDGFTLLAPLTENAGELGLAYRDVRLQRRIYPYQMGRGLVFGDLFSHSTEAGEAQRPVVLLSFTFGTDRMDNWANLARTSAQQGRLHQRPDGVLVRDGVELGPQADLRRSS